MEAPSTEQLTTESGLKFFSQTIVLPLSSWLCTHVDFKQTVKVGKYINVYLNILQISELDFSVYIPHQQIKTENPSYRQV